MSSRSIRGAITLVLLLALFALGAGAAHAAAPKSQVGFSPTTYSVSEDGGNVILTVTRTSNLSPTTTVDYTTVDGPAGSPNAAVAGSDYAGTSGSIVFAPQQKVQTITVPILDDAGTPTDERNEIFSVRLTTASNNPASPGVTFKKNANVATVTIVDNDDAGTLSVNNDSAQEGSNIVFTVTLTPSTIPQVAPVTVNYATANDTAVAPGDYTAQSGTLTFNPSEPPTKTVTVPTINDTTDEANERFFLNLSSPTNATITDNQGVGTIQDNDAAPTLSIKDASNHVIGDPNTADTEGDTPNTVTSQLTFEVTKTGATDRNVTVDFADDPGNQTAGWQTDCAVGGDFERNNGTLTFLPADTSKFITIDVCGDTTDEPDETVWMTLSNPTNATLADALGVGTIVDDDATPSVTIEFESLNCGGPSPGAGCTSYSEDGFDITTTDHFHDNPGQPTSDNALETGIDCTGTGSHTNFEVTLTRTGGGSFDLISLDVEAITGTLTATPDNNSGNAVSFTSTGTKLFSASFQGVTEVDLSMGSSGCVDIDNIVVQ